MTVSIPYHTLIGRRLCPSYPPRDPLWTSGVSSNYSAAERQYLHKADTTIQVNGFDNSHWPDIICIRMNLSGPQTGKKT